MKLGIFIAIAAAVIVIFSCSNEEDGFISRMLKGGEAAVPVTVESVAVRDKALKFTASGEIGSAESADVTAPDEVIVDRFTVELGERVDSGDVVARLSEDEMTLRVVRLRADLREAQSKLEKDSYLLRNRDRLIDEDRIDQERYDKLEGDVETDEAEIERLGQDIARIEDSLGDTALRSPISGIVTKRNVSAGSVVAAGGSVLTVSKVDPAMVKFTLSSDKSAMVRPGTSVRITFPTLRGRRIDGRVTAVDTKVDSETGSFTASASISNPEGIYKSGMRADVEFENPVKQQVFVVPEVAIIKEGRSFFVFTVKDGVAHRVQIIPSQTKGRHVEVIRGLKEADLVVVGGQDKIKEGTKVDIWGR
jgi:RND family efflux transporter MFP subunit